MVARPRRREKETVLAMTNEEKHFANLRAWVKGKPDPFPEIEIPIVPAKPIDAKKNAEAIARLPDWVKNHLLFKQPPRTRQGKGRP
jgi:hypothetical protein